MTYEELVAKVADQSGVNTETVRRVLFHLPDALLQLPVGDDVRTPLGVFRMAQTQPRPITLPDGTTKAEVPAKTGVRLRPGNRLRLEV